MSSTEPENAKSFTETFPQKQSSTTKNLGNEKKVNDLIERIFLITINDDSESKIQDEPKVVLEEIAASVDSSQEKLINLELLEQALFERLLLPSPEAHLRPKSSNSQEAAETKVITYLFRSYVVCERCKQSKDPFVVETCQSIENLIFRNASTSMKQPELYDGQSLHTQWLEIIKDFDNDTEMIRKFLVNTTKEMYSDDKLTSMGSLKAIFYPMFNEIQRKIRTATFTDLDRWVIPLLKLFVSEKTCPELGELVIDYSTPNPNGQGRDYSETLLGLLIGLSILPKFQEDPYIYYGSISDVNNDNYTNSLWTYMESHQLALHGIFKSLLTIGPSVKTKTLAWIGNCLHSNGKRAQLQSVQMLGNLTCASDAFMLGLCSILLYLCAPLCRPGFKVLLVDPTYAAVSADDAVKKNIAMKEMAKETCLLPVEEGDPERASVDSYNFITELFFMTHKAIQLSYEVCQAKFGQNQNMLLRLQNEIELARSQNDSEATNYLSHNYMMAISQSTCLRNTLIEPKNGENLLKFFECSALWLTQITVKTEEDLAQMAAANSYAPKDQKNVSLPIPDYVPHYLRSIPEFLFTNIVNYLEHRRLYEDGGIRLPIDAQNEIFRWILIFMGSIKRTKSPHLRAQLAVAFRCLLPDPSVNSFQIHVFDNHPDRYQIVQNLLNVFVAIEMTGQSVEFELKFAYRRPMYAVMKFLWKREDQKTCFKQLAQDALQNIEAVDPPIFLRFINLLINDAIYLLDDSLSHIKQIREMETTQDSESWTTMSQTDQQTLQRNLNHLTRQTATYNTLSKETIGMLVLITSEIKDIFCHASMVERIAAMLNYFLLNLVGPKKKDFKVKDKSTLEFDPASMVKEICRIYVNLVGSHDFCLAVSQEGRSYSSDLFKYAEEVLAKIGGGQLITDIREFAAKVEQIEKQHKEDQEALIDPPDDFIDPIMSTLMIDPVILPSSKVTVDRSTIARHLLSDQTDPFNRSPLTMDQVQSNEDLKKEINEWIGQKRLEYNERKAGPSGE